MAQLGIRTLRRADRPHRPARHAARASSTGRRRASISRAIFHQPQMPAGGRALPLRDAGPRPREGARPPADRARAAGARARARRSTIDMPIRNINRTVGTMLSGEIAQALRPRRPAGRHDPRRASPARPDRASARSSRSGVTLDLIGDTNDYCGKGLSGGRISVQPSPKFRGEPTREHHHRQRRAVRRDRGRSVFPRRRRRALRVRNSGAQAVVEGVGDHGCEYMTGGTVVVLGHDRAQLRRRHVAAASPTCSTRTATFASAATRRWSTLEPVLRRGRAAKRSSRASSGTWARPTRRSLQALIEQHVRYTGSARARDDPRRLGEYRARFVKVFPNEYRRALGEMLRDAQAASAPEHAGARRRSRWARSPASWSIERLAEAVRSRRRSA